jgi:hypothetical protein
MHFCFLVFRVFYHTAGGEIPRTITCRTLRKNSICHKSTKHDYRKRKTHSQKLNSSSQQHTNSHSRRHSCSMVRPVEATYRSRALLFPLPLPCRFGCRGESLALAVPVALGNECRGVVSAGDCPSTAVKGRTYVGRDVLSQVAESQVRSPSLAEVIDVDVDFARQR